MSFVKNPLKLVAIVGPTASGKSALAVMLAQKFNGVIISADSRQVYKGLDVGTAKIPVSERGGIEHHLLDAVNPDEDFSVSEYQHRVYEILDQIRQHNTTGGAPLLPILVGGTGLYVDAVIQGFDFSGAAPDPALRLELEAKPLADLVAQLRKLEPDTAVDTKNPRRVIRRLEILLGGQGRLPGKQDPGLEVLKLGVGADIETVEQRIRQRIATLDFDQLQQETVRLIELGLDFDSNPLTALYYRPMREYMEGKLSREELETKLILGDRQYAKRQLTWWKRDRAVVWVDGWDQALSEVADFVGLR